MFTLSWNDYFGNMNIDQIHENERFSSSSQAINISEGNAYILLCDFYDLNAYDGGAILYNVNDHTFLIERCSFLKCSALRYTAAIRVGAYNSILSYICGYDCHSDINDGFCSISSKKINSIFDSSISNCKTVEAYISVLRVGISQIKSTNMSNNFVGSVSGFESQPSDIDKENGYSGFIGYSSFFNNSAKIQYCLEMSHNTYKHLMKYSNIIGNQAKNTFWCKGEIEINHCSIFNNANPCFETMDENTKIILIASSTDNTNESGSGKFTQSETTNLFIVLLTFIETGKCHNLFVQFYPSMKYQTLHIRILGLSILMMKCMFISILSE